MEKIKLNTYESNPEWDSLEIKQTWSDWYISSLPNGEVEIECHSDGGASEHVFLNQDELRVLIAFLQTKLR